MNNKVPVLVATMTSWKGRISTTGKMIDDFLTKQTIKPSIFYLWLSREEFPKEIHDLPDELVKVISKYNIQLKWLDGNEYCHKRWYVYPQHYDDYVISIDDDCYYSPTIIQDSLQMVNSFKNTICCLWWQFSAIPNYNNDAKITWSYDLKHFSMRNWFTANSMIPPRTFPLEALDEKTIEYRNRFATKHDEAWLIPFFLKHDINIAFVPRNYPFKTVERSQEVALSDTVNEKKIGEYKQSEISLYCMLKHTGMLEKYKMIHKGYDYGRISEVVDC